MHVHAFVDNCSSQVKLEEKYLKCLISTKTVWQIRTWFLTYCKFITVCSTQTLLTSPNRKKKSKQWYVYFRCYSSKDNENVKYTIFFMIGKNPWIFIHITIITHVTLTMHVSCYFDLLSNYKIPSYSLMKF